MEIQNKEEFILSSEEEMAGVVQRIVPLLKAGDVLFLWGDLGAGKTTFTRFLLKALGYADRVKSPTFTVVEPYDLRKTHGFSLYHYDLYRFSAHSWDEIELLGIRDQWAEKAILLIEWPDRLEGFFEPTLELTFEFLGENQRKVTLQPKLR